MLAEPTAPLMLFVQYADDVRTFGSAALAVTCFGIPFAILSPYADTQNLCLDNHGKPRIMAVAKLREQVFSPQIPIGILIVLAILYVAKVVILPLAVAILLTFILTPIVVLLQRYGVKRVYAVSITVVLALSAFGASGYIIGTQIHSLAVGLPTHKNEIKAKIDTLREGGGGFARLIQMVREISNAEGNEKSLPGPSDALKKEVIVTRPEESSSAARVFEAIVPILEPLANAGFVVVLVIFMLFHREDLRNRFLGLLGGGRLTGTTRVIVDSAQRLSSYLLTQLLINLAFGAIFAIGLYIIDVEYAILWGFVTTLMRFVPYIGTWIAVLLPLTLSFATSTTWAQPITLLVGFASLDLVTANVVEPLLLGHRTGVSPMALLVAAAFWTWLWGPMGLVLSTPLTVCLVVLGQHVPRFQFFALLLGDQPPLKPKVRYYQRLLARDKDEAQEVAVEYAKASGLDQLYDHVLIPALVMARRDRRDAGLDAEDEEFILHTTREILEGIEVNPPPGKSPEPIPTASPAENPGDGTEPAVQASEAKLPYDPRILILGCPAHQQAEELALQMLANLLKPEGCDVKAVSTRTLPAEIETRIASDVPALVFIAVLPPGGLVQARFLCKRIRRRFPDLPIVVGFWGEAHDFDKLFRQVRSAGGNYVATSLLQARSQIDAILRPPTGGEIQRETAALQEA
jgi:predicted PurR-regulated permease PerM